MIGVIADGLAIAVIAAAAVVIIVTVIRRKRRDSIPDNPNWMRDDYPWAPPAEPAKVRHFRALAEDVLADRVPLDKALEKVKQEQAEAAGIDGSNRTEIWVISRAVPNQAAALRRL